MIEKLYVICGVLSIALALGAGVNLATAMMNAAQPERHNELSP